MDREICFSHKDHVEYNRQLIEKYPFLLPHNRWTDEISEDYDYSYTELDAMPDGWRKVFGEQMCQEIKDALGEHINRYRIMQIKEKYGSLRWYANFETEESIKVVQKYSILSEKTCIECGNPATRMSVGYILPLCDECAEHTRYETIPIEEYFNDEI